MKSFWGLVCLFACLNNVSVLSDQTENQVVEEGNPIIVENANSALLDFVQSSDFYEVQSNEIVYYVAWAENEGDDKYLIRTTEDFSQDVLLNDRLLDSSEKMIEVQKYNSESNVFNQYFEYIGDDVFESIKNKAILSDDEDIRLEILSSFQYKLDYLKNCFSNTTKNVIERSPQVGQSFISDINDQVKLDNYIKLNRSKTTINALSINNQTERTIDDHIVSLIPRQYFLNTCTKTEFGAEWGYYINTYSISSYGDYASDVFLFDVKIDVADEKNMEVVTLSPVENATFVYTHDIDVVSYYQENTFCITKPIYVSNIRYVSDYVMTFNDYDETEYIPINEHPLNPDEQGYDPKNDCGMFFGTNGFVAESAKPFDFAKKVGEYILNATVEKLVDLIPNELVSMAVGKVFDGVGIFTQNILPSLLAGSKSTAGSYGTETVKGRKKYNHLNVSTFNLNDDEKRYHKFVYYDLSNVEDLKLTTKEDYISFYSSVMTSKMINVSYKALISHALSFDLCKIKTGGISEVCDFFNNIAYLYQPCYQTDDMVITSPKYMGRSMDVSLANTKQEFVATVKIDEDANYLFDFSNIVSCVHINFSDGESFYSDFFEKKALTIKDVNAPSLKLPNQSEFHSKKYLTKGTQIKIRIIRYFGTFGTNDIGYYSCNLSMNICKLENNSIANFEDNISSLDNTYITYTTSSDFKTIMVSPKCNGLYTFHMNDKKGNTMYSVTDIHGRKIYDSYGGKSSERIVLSLCKEQNYLIHFKSYDSSHDVSFCVDKNRYLYSSLSYLQSDYGYYNKNATDFTYLFSPSNDTKAYISVPTNPQYVTFRIYDENRNLLKEIKNPTDFEYSFTANCHYYLQMKYLTNDSNILDSSVLRVRRLA